MPTFPGPDFALETVTATAFTTIRVKFTQDPQALDPTAVNDALNPANYSLTGAKRNHILSCAKVVGDPQSIDLTTKFPLLVGGWNLAVANIVEDNSSALVAPTSLDFLVTIQPGQTPLPGGATNDEAAAVIRKFLNPALVGSGWDSMIAALAAGDAANWDDAKNAFDQLFISTASGIYLDRRAGDVGQKRPDGVDMADDLFRRLATISKTRKLTQEAVLEVLEVFYGRDAVRASTTSTAFEPYVFNDGDDLVLLVDEKDVVTVTFKNLEFVRIAVSKAEEVATAITRALKAAGNQAFAIAQTDQTTGQVGVRIYSGSLGLSSSIRVIGGKVQTQLLFPKSLFVPSGSPPYATWNVTLSPTPGNLRFTMTAGTVYDLTLVQSGDLAYIYGPEFAACGCNGTYTIAAVSITYSGATRTQWFEIVNPNGVAGSGVVQPGFTDLMFFRPIRNTIYDQSRHVIVAQADDELDIIMPATTQAVARGPGIAAYLNEQPALAVSSLVRKPTGDVTVTTAASHGLAVGDQVIIDGVQPSGAFSPVTAGTPSPDFSSNVANGNTNASLATTASEAHTFQGVNHQVLRLPEGMLMIVGGQTQTDLVTITSIANPVIFEIVSETVDGTTGGREQNYRWTNLATRSYHIGRRAFGASVSSLNGLVLVTGGTDGDDVTGTPKNTWDLFTYTKAPPQNAQSNGTMPAARVAHGQCSLGIYGELICGGWTSPGVPITTAYIFDTVAMTWTARASMTLARMYHQVVPLPGSPPIGLVIGGKTATAILAACELYDPNANTWTSTCPMTYARYGYGAVSLPDGRVIVLGGTGYNVSQDTTPTVLTSVELYDPATKLWSVLPSMTVPRMNPAAAYVASKNVVMVAGSGSAVIDILDLSTMRWSTSVSSVANPLMGTVAGVAGVDTFVLTGGIGF